MLTHRIAFAAMLFAVSACATATSPESLEAREDARAAEVFANDIRRGDEVRKVCFASHIDSFGETTKRAVVIREGGDYYLVETFPGCFDLDWAQSLAIDSFSSCLSKGDRIIAFDSVFPHDRRAGFTPACRVKTIYAWDPDAEAAEPDETDTDTSDEIQSSAR